MSAKILGLDGKEIEIVFEEFPVENVEIATSLEQAAALNKQGLLVGAIVIGIRYDGGIDTLCSTANVCFPMTIGALELTKELIIRCLRSKPPTPNPDGAA